MSKSKQLQLTIGKRKLPAEFLDRQASSDRRLQNSGTFHTSSFQLNFSAQRLKALSEKNAEASFAKLEERRPFICKWNGTFGVFMDMGEIYFLFTFFNTCRLSQGASNI